MAFIHNGRKHMFGEDSFLGKDSIFGQSFQFYAQASGSILDDTIFDL